jgi:hypothetical protein
VSREARLPRLISGQPSPWRQGANTIAWTKPWLAILIG